MNKRGNLDSLVLIVISLAVVVAMSASFFVSFPKIKAAENNWYVDNQATGLNDGTSWSTAWNSFANINWASIQPGDTIYISGGSTSKVYNENLIIEASGISGNPITIRPGQDAGHNGIVTISGYLDINSKSYLIIDGLTISFSSTSAYYDNAAVRQVTGTSNYVTIQNCWVKLTGVGPSSGLQYGFGLMYINNWNINHCKIDIMLTGSGNAADALGIYPGKDVYIGYNEINNNGGLGLHTEDGFEIMGGYITIENNLIYDGWHTDDATGHNDGIVVQCSDNGLPTYTTTNVVIRNNEIRNFNQNFYIDALWCDLGPTQFYNNVLYFQSSPRAGVGISIDGEYVTGGAYYKTPVEIYNNIIDMAANGGVTNNNAINVLRQNPSGTDNQQVFKNNIFLDATRNQPIEIQSGTSHVTFDYNYYSNCDSPWVWGGVDKTWSQWQAIPQDTYGAIGNANLNPDYTPKSNSPTNDIGIDLSSYFTTDKLGISRPQGCCWDMGAYEYDELPGYYVDFLNGNDNNDGLSTSSPWKHAPGDTAATGNAASTTPQPGDFIYFKKGVTYQGKIIIKNSGTSGNPITYSSTNWGTGDAVIDGTDNIFVLNGADYIAIENLKLISTTSHMIDFGSGQCDYITVQNNIFESNIAGYAIRLHYCANLDIRNNQIYMTNGGWGIYTLKTNTGNYVNNLIDGTSDMTTVGDGLVVSGTNLLIENNQIYGLMNTASHSDGIVIQGDGDRDGNPTNNVKIRNNKLRGCTQCIYLDAIWGELQNVKVYNNVIWSTPAEDSIVQSHAISIDPENCAACGCGSGCGWSMPGLEVYHNTIYVTGCGLCDGTRNAPNIQMGTYKNNLLINKNNNYEQAYRMRDNPPPSFSNVDNNWIYADQSGNVYKWISTLYDTPAAFCSAAGHECSVNSYALIEPNPGQSANFVDLANYDFHPTSSSLFINKGVSYSERTTDADGNPIIGTPDIGAYEYVPGGTTTTTIPGSTTTTITTTTTTTTSSTTTTLSYDIERTIETGSDDVNAWGSSGWDMTTIHEWMGNSGASENTGLRFNSINIPNSANIIEAYVMFTASESSSLTIPNLEIKGEASDNALTFSTRADYDSKPRTISSTNWQPSSWTINNNYYTPNIQTIIQEVINRPGWQSGNSLVLFVEDSGSISSNLRKAASYEHATYSAPYLLINYASASTTTTTSSTTTSTSTTSSITSTTSSTSTTTSSTTTSTTTTSSTTTTTTTTTTIFQIELQQGWNLIGIPYAEADPRVESVFSEILNKLVTIYSYITPKKWEVYHNSQSIPYHLFTVNDRQGYWVKVNQSATLINEGIINNTKLNYNIGWNLIAVEKEETLEQHLDANNKIKEAYNYSINNNSYTYLPKDITLYKGRGYWILVNETI